MCVGVWVCGCGCEWVGEGGCVCGGGGFLRVPVHEVERDSDSINLFVHAFLSAIERERDKEKGERGEKKHRIRRFKLRSFI